MTTTLSVLASGVLLADGGTVDLVSVSNSQYRSEVIMMGFVKEHISNRPIGMGLAV